MRRFYVDVSVTAEYTVEVEAIDADEAMQIAENMECAEIEDEGDFSAVMEVQATWVREVEVNRHEDE